MRTHHMRPATWHRIHSASFVAGLCLILITTIDVEAMGIFRLGVLFAIIGGVQTIVDKVAMDVEEKVQARMAGYDDGYDDGCEDGREIRPSSKFSAVGSAVARLPLSRPAQQLGEQDDVGDGEKRVL